MKNTPSSVNQNDPVKPGENFFCYWKTSAALWEQKLSEFPRQEVIFVPIYWGLHATMHGMWDFGKEIPELDLGRLAQLMTQHKRQFIWIIPVGPAPFLPNGGLPIGLARTLSVNADGVIHTAFDQQGQLHKMYSFFGKDSFSSFSQFLNSLANYFEQNRMSPSIWGHLYGYTESSRVRLYLEDYSQTFEQGFSRYLKKKYPLGLESLSPNEEEALKTSYRDEVKSLFVETAAEILSPFWKGVKVIEVLAGAPIETLERGLFNEKSAKFFFQQIMNCYSQGRWFSSALLNPKEKRQLFLNFLSEHFGKDEIEKQYNLISKIHFDDSLLSSYHLIELYTSSSEIEDEINRDLIKFLEQKYRWIFRIKDELDFSPEGVKLSEGKIKIFHAQGLDRTHFSQMLKLFLMGEKVIFNLSGLSSELKNRLEVFMVENSLNIQTVNYQTEISVCELGEGRLVIFQGEKLNSSNAYLFWGQVFHFLHLNHPFVQADEEVYGVWRVRGGQGHELNFIDIRRVNLYNPTSYKKNIYISTLKRFAPLKTENKNLGSVRTTGDGVEIELLPGGYLDLEFGHYRD